MASNEIGPQGFELMCSALATRQISEMVAGNKVPEKKKTESVPCLHGPKFSLTCWYELVKFGGTLQKKYDGLKPYSVPY